MKTSAPGPLKRNSPRLSAASATCAQCSALGAEIERLQAELRGTLEREQAKQLRLSEQLVDINRKLQTERQRSQSVTLPPEPSSKATQQENERLLSELRRAQHALADAQTAALNLEVQAAEAADARQAAEETMAALVGELKDCRAELSEVRGDFEELRRAHEECERDGRDRANVADDDASEEAELLKAANAALHSRVDELEGLMGKEATDKHRLLGEIDALRIERDLLLQRLEDEQAAMIDRIKRLEEQRR